MYYRYRRILVLHREVSSESEGTRLIHREHGNQTTARAVEKKKKEEDLP